MRRTCPSQLHLLSRALDAAPFHIGYLPGRIVANVRQHPNAKQNSDTPLKFLLVDKEYLASLKFIE